ncbi:MAG: AsmA-like C-terminal region-containing protein, partial [Thermodesulfovibrionales bacterium]|nr:AsmA-like C-terminal region-containing protein [Thermodesulfovibrionales bacterium]
VVNVSGTFREFPADIRKIELSLQGDIGPGATSWVSRLIDLPTEMQLRPPLTVTDAAVSWEKETKTKFDGRFVFGTGTEVSLKLTKTPDELSVHEISIKDRDTDVTANAMLNKKTIDLVFKGILASSTINTIFAHAMSSDSSLKGDFLAHILLKDPKQSRVEGVIDGKNLSIPLGLTVPLIVRNITLEAKDENFSIKTAQIKAGEQEVTLTGTISTSPTWFTVNMDLTSDSIDFEKVQRIVQRNKQTDSKGHPGLFDDIPVKGTLRVRSDAFQYRQFKWQPFHADVSFDGDTMHIRSKKAALCGISTTGDIDITAGGAEIDVALSAKNLELEPTILCISDKKVDVTGIFDMKADLKARGKLDTIAKSLNGSFTISAKKGKIFKSQSLDKTLDLVNETENVKGTLPDLNKTIIDYRAFTASGKIKEHIVDVEQATLDASTFGILAQGQVDLRNETLDVNALVAPVNRVQRIVGKIPVLGHILGGNLVSFPVKIKGNLSDPEVTFLSPSAIGSAFLGIMERTLKLPITIIEPILPAKK